MKEIIGDLVMMFGFILVMGVVGGSDYEVLTNAPAKPFMWYIVNFVVGMVVMVVGYKLPKGM